MKHMTAPSWARQPALPIFALVALASGYLQGCDSECTCATGPDSGTSGPPPDAAWVVKPDASPSDTNLRTGFSTWSYQGTPMGLYVPASTGTPLPVVTFLHACHNDPVYENHWIIAALNAIEPVAVFLPTAPPATTSLAPIGAERMTKPCGRT
jgi:hypothetical protein